jgi:hypothetical protein
MFREKIRCYVCASILFSLIIFFLIFMYIIIMAAFLPLFAPFLLICEETCEEFHRFSEILIFFYIALKTVRSNKSDLIKQICCYPGIVDYILDGPQDYTCFISKGLTSNYSGIWMMCCLEFFSFTELGMINISHDSLKKPVLIQRFMRIIGIYIDFLKSKRKQFDKELHKILSEVCVCISIWCRFMSLFCIFYFCIREQEAK